MLTFAYKWYGESTTKVKGLPDYENYKADTEDDSALIKDLWALFDEADIVIGHNGDRFDIRKTNAKFIQHDILPPSPYQTIDTLKVARKYFAFTSNRLDALGELLGVGRKTETGGFSLWKGCMAGDKKAWNLMKKYNKQDVKLLEDVYEQLRPWMTNHPNMNTFNGEGHNCPVCDSLNVQKRGYRRTRTGKYQAYACQECGAWSQGRANLLAGQVENR